MLYMVTPPMLVYIYHTWILWVLNTFIHRCQLDVYIVRLHAEIIQKPPPSPAQIRSNSSHQSSTHRPIEEQTFF